MEEGSYTTFGSRRVFTPIKEEYDADMAAICCIGTVTWLLIGLALVGGIM